MENKVTNFDEFLSEANLKGNLGIPGEDPSKKDDPSYLSNVRGRSAERLSDIKSRLNPGRFMEYVDAAHEEQAPYKKELEKLAEEVIRIYYGSILSKIKLDIKFPEQGELKQMMDKTKEKPDKSKKKPDMQNINVEKEKLEDKGIKDEIERRKIGKNLVQGAGKNTKLILNLDETYNGFVRIMGEEKARKYSDLLNKITDICDIFDWEIPDEHKIGYWRTSEPAGVTDLKFKDEDANEFLDSLKKDDEDYSEKKMEEVVEDIKADVIARGKDYAMLIHETVKGIWNLALSASIPQDPDVASVVIDNTDTLFDEMEDLKYGPYIERDFNNFILGFEELAPEVPNLKERVFFRLIQMQPASDFLDFFYAFLNGFVMGNSADLAKAEKVVKKNIQEIKSEWDNYLEQLEDYERASSEYDEDQYDTEEEIAPDVTTQEPIQKDDEYYSKLSKSEIEKEIDDALDRGDFKTVKMLSKFINESTRAKYSDIFDF